MMLEGNGWVSGLRHGVTDWRYAFHQFPERVQSRQVLDLVERALGEQGDWAPVAAGLDGDGYRTWMHRGSAQRVSMVVTGIRPLLLSIGAHPAASAAGGPGETRRQQSLASDAVARALDAGQQVASRLGGRELQERDVLALVDQAQRAYGEWVRDEQRVAELAASLDGRTCPSCRAQVAFAAARCRSCGYRFTPHDDLQRDEQRARALHELRSLQSRAQPAPARPDAPGPPGTPPAGAHAPPGGRR
ncbi:MAG TPA: zinc ribbon domain-containing protein [Actinomycetes bacterium]|nr:zinc ribbon domain-containing protein [Actinomycetes bacterium]